VTTILLLGAGGSAAANVLDALRRANSPYLVIGADASAVKLHLSDANERMVLPRASEDGYAAAVVAAVEQFGCDVVHPQPDPDVLAVGKLRDEIPAATYLPAQTALELASDKLAFTSRLRDAGVAVPETVAFSEIDDVAPTTAKLLTEHDRVWVRARRGAGSRASLPVRSGAQAEAWVRWWIEERGLSASDFMASEFLPGREFAYQSVWQDGELVAGQARERLEYLYGHLTPSGQTSTPAVARTVDEPAVDELALQSIRALDAEPRGAYCVDIKESGSGPAKVTEINAGRFFTTSNFFATAGLNMPDLLVRCALGERPPRRGSSPLPPDLFWIRMVDMGYVLVPGDTLDPWPRAHR
jgi:glutathione synthase/RimK-type ligase-like ATP-grasp enzyme